MERTVNILVIFKSDFNVTYRNTKGIPSVKSVPLLGPDTAVLELD